MYLYYETVTYAPDFTKAATKTNGGSVKQKRERREDESIVNTEEIVLPQVSSRQSN